LAATVIISHSFEILDGDRHREPLTQLFHSFSFGELAVNGFFIISGYLIAQSAVQTQSPLRFLRKRVLRIYPGFLLATVISCFVAGYIGAAVRSPYFQTFPYGHFFKMLPILEVPEIPGIFAGQAYPSVNGSTWTLRFEFACYLSMLISIYLIRPKSGRVALIIASSMLAIYAAFMLGHVNPHIIISDPRSLVRLTAFYYSGTILYYYRQYILPTRWVALAILWVALMFAARFIPSDSVRYVVDTIVTMTVGASALLSAGFTPRVETGLGTRDYSYGVYLYGWPVTKVLVYYVPSISPWALFFGSLAGAVLLASVSWHFIERPALARK
jgi:peptidoglycan/LPS O-acetylase OafA/YrhL